MRIISYFLTVFVLAGLSSTAQMSLPYFEDFEGSPVDSGWTVTTASVGSDGWTFGTNQFSQFWYPVPDDPSLGAYAISNDENCQCDKSADFLYSPAIDISGVSYLKLDFTAFFTGFQGAKGYVFVSTDQGLTWPDTVYTMSSGTTWEDISVDLTAYTSANQINVGFMFADGGTDDFGYAIDNVSIYVPLTHNLQIVDYTLPVSGCSLSSGESIVLEVKNDGYLDAINFDMKYSLDGGVTYVTETVSNTLVSGDILQYTFNQTGDFSIAGIYNVQFEVVLTGDQDLSDNTAGPVTITSLATIDQFPFTENFESGVGYSFYLESETEANASLATNAGNSYILLEGGSPTGWTGLGGTTTESNAWNDNTSHHAFINTCGIDATGLTTVQLQFDLDQKFSYATSYSWFRLLVNGNPVSDVNGTESFNPSSTNSTFQTITYDLSSYAGTVFTIQFQSSNWLSSSVTTPGHLTLIDNIAISGNEVGAYSLPFTEDFDNMNPGWSQNTASGSWDGWVYAAEYYNSFWFPVPANENQTVAATSNDLVCYENNGYTQDCDKSDDYLISPQLDLTGYFSVELNFDYFLSYDQGGESMGFVYITTDGTLANKQLVATLDPTVTGGGWDAVSPIDLSAYAGNIVKLIFEHDDNGTIGEGFSIDNISVTGSTVFPVYSLPFIENFDNMNAGWSQSTASGSSDGWVYAAEYYNSFWFPVPANENQTVAATSNDLVCYENNGYTQDCDKSDDYLISPQLDLTGYFSVELNFDYFLSYDQGGESMGFVYITTDGTLANKQLVATLDPTVTGGGWDAVSPIDLSAYAGNIVKLIFEHDDNGTIGEGFSIDNISVTGSTIFPVYSLPFTENFDNMNAGWSQSTASGSSDGWVYAAEYYNSFWFPLPSNENQTVAATSNDLICYENNGYTQDCDKSEDYLISPGIDLTGYFSAELMFDYFLSYDQGGESMGSVYVSTDGTTNNMQLILNLPQTITGGGWEAITSPIDLSAYVGDTINIVFLHDDNSTVGEGFSVDNISITGLQYPPIEITYDVTDVLCNGDLNGAIDILTTTGGLSSNYSYAWSNGSTSQNISGLAAGSYVVSVSDGMGNEDTFTIIVNQPDALSLFITETDISCYGEIDGELSVSVSGGVSPFTYLWSNNEMTEMIDGLSAGNYDVVVTDANFCTTTMGGTIVEPASITITGVVTDATCSTSSDGAVDITVNGGTQPYTYIWQPGQTTEDISNLTPGVYEIAIVDANFCTQVASFTVGYGNFTASLIATDALCFGSSDGTLSVTLVGGTAPFSYTWSNGATGSATITGLAANTYEVTVADAGGCITTASGVVGQPLYPGLNSSLSNVSCNGLSDGSINLTITYGGTPPFTYLWSDGSTNEDLLNVEAGTYQVTATDANGCEYTSIQYTVSEPDTLTVTETITEVSCNGLGDGEISIVVAGGTTPYSYLWDDENNSTISSISNLVANTYNVTITDANGCIFNVGYTLTDPASIVVTDTTITDVTCPGGLTGAIDIEVTGGTAPIDYAWSDGTTVVQDLSGAAAGAYTVTITDANGCEIIETYTITEPAAFAANETITNVTCNAAADGSIVLNPTGGTAPYTYLWGTGETTDNITGLSGNTYTVDITDASSCVYSETFVVAEPAVLALTATHTDVDCAGNMNGSIDLTITGGTGPYIVEWDGVVSSEDLSAIAGGTYVADVSDANGCTAQITVIVAEPAALTISELIANVTCNGDADGAIDLTVSGGVTPYYYSWTNSSITQDISGLSGGTYGVTVTDGNWCSLSMTYDIIEPDVLSYTADVSTSAYNGYGVSCNGMTDGYIDLTITGGTTPYVTDWGTSTSEDQLNIGPGSYNVQISDANGCAVSNNLVIPWTYTVSSSSHVILIQAPTINGSTIANGDYIGVFYTDTATNQLECGGYTVWSGGPVAGITAWGSESGTSTNLGFQAGEQFSFKVWRAGDGSVVDMTPSYLIPNTDLFTVNGQSVLTGLSGTAPALNPVGSGSWTLTEPPVLSVTSVVSHVICNGDGNGVIDITTSGGVTPYSYYWSDGSSDEDLMNLSGGTYTVTITDANGCVEIITETVNEPGAISLNEVITDISCYGMLDGSVTLNFSGPVTPYTFAWSNGETTEDVSGLFAGIYGLTITDGVGCEFIYSYTVNEPNELIADLTGSSYNGFGVTCNGASDGSLNVSVTGGTTPYAYNWSNIGSGASSQQNLLAGTYSVTVTDDNGCTAVPPTSTVSPVNWSYTITSHNHPIGIPQNSVTIDGSPIVSGDIIGVFYDSLGTLVCGGYSIYQGANTVVVAWGATGVGQYDGFAPNETFKWKVYRAADGVTADGVAVFDGSYPNGDNYVASGLSAVSSITATSVVAPPTEISITLIEPVVIGVDFTLSDYNGYNVSCFGSSDGSVVATPNGGTGTYTYLWGDGSTTNHQTGVEAGWYFVTVYDSNNCAYEDSVELIAPAGISAYINATSNNNGYNISCNGASDGSAEVIVNGGESPYTYEWSDGSTSSVITGVGAGMYTVTVTDSIGCEAVPAVVNTDPVYWYTPAATSTNHTIVIQSSALIDIDGNPINNGDYVGVFYDSVGTEACGGFVVWNGSNNILVAWGAEAGLINGFAPNEEFKWKIYRASDGVTVDAVATYDNVNYSETSQYVGSGISEVLGISGTEYDPNLNEIFVELIEPNALSIDLTVSDFSGYGVSCNGATDGSIVAVVSGGVAPFTYSWSNGGTNTFINGLAPATYTLNVSDANGCTAVAQADVTEPGVIAISDLITEPLCNGSSDGSIDITPTGTTTPYTYSWSNGDLTEDLLGVMAGSYGLTVTDQGGCTSEYTFVITEPTMMMNTVTISDYNGFGVSCNGSTDGSIAIVTTGGTAPYSYNWSNIGAGADTQTGLTAGMYYFTVTDVNNCTYVDSVELTSPVGITAYINSLSNNNGYDISCNGASDGSAQVIVNGGLAPYSYAWSNGATTETVSGLSAGNYTVTVTDSLGCTALPATINTDPVYWYNPTIATSSNHTILIQASAVIDIDGNAINNGDYVGVFYDSVGTEACGGYIVWNGANNILVAWGANSGSINGFAPNEEFKWKIYRASDGVTVDAAATYDNVNYSETSQYVGSGISEVLSISGTEYNPNINEISIDLNEPGLLDIDLTVSDFNGFGVTCNGATDGSVVAVVNGGVSPFGYAWSSGGTNSFINALGPDTYTLTVTDANGCTAVNQGIINEPDQLLVTGVASNVSCNGNADGSVDLTVTGGASPMTFIWSNGASTEDISGLAAGTYVVDVIDANGCQLFGTSFTVLESQIMSLSAVVTNSNCVGASNGMIDLTVTGGLTPHTFSWDNGATTEDVTGLGAGNYAVTVTDDNGCTISDSYTVIEIPGMTTSINGSDYNGYGVSCFGAADGYAEAIVTGGTSPYTFAWTGSASTTELAENLTAGTYTVSITDANACILTETITLTEPTQIVSGAVQSLYNGFNISCNGATDGSITLNVSGGSSPYSYEWDNGDTTDALTGLAAGNYELTITDASNCSVVDIITLTEPAILFVSANVTDISCNGLTDGAIDATITGGISPYTISWSDGSTTEDLNNLGAGTYSITVSDINLCSQTFDFTVIEPDVIATNPAISNVSCNGGSDGEIVLAVSGGTAPYSYAWANPVTSTNETASGLTAGSYTVTVTDVNGCTMSEVFTVSEPQLLLADITGTDISCFGGSDGTATVTVTGGTAPYSYNWSSPVSSTTNFADNLTAGTYSVTVTDANGCIAVTTLPGTAVVSAWVSNPTANSHLIAIQGTASITIDGTPIAIGDQVGVFYDSLGTMACAGFVTWNGSNTVISAWGADFGQINGYNTGDSFNWYVLRQSDGALVEMTATYSTVMAPNGGTFQDGGLSEVASLTGTAVTGGGYANDISVVLTEPLQLVSNATVSDYNGVNVSCNGETDGSIVLQVNGGVLPYSYAWSNGGTTAFLNNIGAGTYDVTISDANGCELVESYTLTEPDLLDVTAVITNVSCFGLSDGFIDITPIGGTAPYTFLWSTGMSSTNEDLGGIPAGTYMVYITDANGCSLIDTFEVTEPDPLISSYSQVNVSCFGFSDGAINLEVNGGTQPYSYDWDNDGTGDNDDTQNLNNLVAGTYSVIITDANGCISTQTVVITEPTQVVISLFDPGLSVNNGYSISCYGGNNGAIDATVTGGTPPYYYSWSTGESTEDIMNLIAGTYDLTVVDDNGCEVVSSIIMTEPDSIEIQFSNTVMYNGQMISCHGASDGAIMASVTGGVTPYAYSWSEGSTTAAISGLSAGFYTVTITDANGCIMVDTYEVTEPDPIENYFEVYMEDCDLDNTGVIIPHVSGGTAPYTYMWTFPNSGYTSTNDTITDLSGGNYDLMVTDVNGCVFVTSYYLQQPSQSLEIVVDTVVHIDCFGDLGTANITPIGGVLDYEITWTDANGTIITNNEDLEVSTPGLYIVLLEDSLGCYVVDSITIEGPTAPLDAAISSSTNVSCNGMMDGNASATVTGGTPPYSYVWTNQNNTPVSVGSNLTNVGAGTYTFEVTDANGCVDTEMVTITEPDVLEITGFTVTDVDCNGAANGKIVLTVAGGTPWAAGYNYLWSNGATTDSLFNVSGGNYAVTITDSLGCTTYGNWSVAEPALLLETAVVTDVDCYGASTGMIDLTVTGGIAPYTFAWDNGATTEDLSGVIAGNYNVVITDANGCTLNGSYTIIEPLDLVLTSSSVNVTCNGLSNASIDLTVNGGTVPYSYNWNSGMFNTQDLNGIPAGLYTVVVTDANGCEDSTTVTITEPAVLEIISSTITDVDCNGAAIGMIVPVVIGGTPWATGYSFQWSNGSTNDSLMNVAGGTYMVTITDSLGCMTVGSWDVYEPTALDISAMITDVDCNGNANGAIDVTVTGGTAGYTFSWDNGATSEDLTGLAGGTYAVTVTDANGCTIAASYNVFEPTALLLNATVVDVSCFGGSNGSAVASVSGGTAPYEFVWTDGSSVISLVAQIGSMPAGTYYLQITDANNCILNDSVTITEPDELLINTAIVQNVDCNGNATGSIDISVIGGTPDINSMYSYEWSNGATTQDLSNVVAGTYTVTVTDDHNCEVVGTYVVTEPAELLITNAVITDVSCFGYGNGSIDITIEGGTTAYTYDWSNGSSNEDLTAVDGGTYTVTVTDANGCEVIETYVVNEPNMLMINSLTDLGLSIYNNYSVSCFGEEDGAVLTDIQGGVGPYAYTWTDSSGTLISNLAQITNVGAGMYYITVQDANGCEVSSMIQLIEPPQIEVTAIVTNVLCNGNATGAIDVTTTGGTGIGTYNWLWQNGATTEDLSGLTAGTYELTVTDLNGCFEELTLEVTEPPLLTATLDILTDFNGYAISCNGAADAELEVFPAGGAGAYTYMWNTGDNTAAIANADTGYYAVTVTDANGCTIALTSAYVDEPTLVEGNLLVTSDYNGFGVSCNGASDGSMEVSSWGGVPIHTYLWSSGEITSSISGKPAGIYFVTITDGNGCELVLTDTIKEADELSVTNIFVQNSTCFGDQNGEIIIEVDGGVESMDYDFWWSNSATNDTLEQLGPGTYHVTISDANGCMIDTSVVITEPDMIVIDLDDIQNDDCDTTSHVGSISITVSGGTGGVFTYNWSGPGGTLTTEDISGLESGYYYLTVTDANGICQETASFFVDVDGTTPMANFMYVITGGNVTFINTSSGAANITSSHWDFDDGNDATVTGAGGTFHEYTYTDTFYVTLTVFSPCGDSDTTIAIYVRPLDIDDILSDESITVYPNPNDGRFNLMIENENLSGDLVIRIMDYTGRVVTTDLVNVSGTVLKRFYDISQFSYGTYMVQVITDKGTVTKPVVFYRR